MGAFYVYLYFNAGVLGSVTLPLVRVLSLCETRREQFCGLENVTRVQLSE